MALIAKDKITFGAGLTISIRDGNVYLIVEDDEAASRFLELVIGQAEFVQALGGLAFIPCVAEVTGLDRIGKRHEHRTLEFPLSKSQPFDYDKDLARKEVYEHLPGEEWEPDLHFGSQNSFFEKDGKDWARTIIRRWVSIPKLKERLKKAKKKGRKNA